jgi:TusA-related sulfurtransferase
MTNRSEEESWQGLGAAWIRAIADHDFQQISQLCQTNVRSRLVTPSRVSNWENADDLVASVRGWFEETSQMKLVAARVDRVGPKVAINYRLSFREDGEWQTVEQQVYGLLQDGLFERLDLLCSGFQPLAHPVDLESAGRAHFQQAEAPLSVSNLPSADSLLVFNTQPIDQGSTCALLTPAIKARLSQMRSGQVLEVRVDDPEAKADIESWSRLSGNELLAMVSKEHPADEPGGLSLFLKKK